MLPHPLQPARSLSPSCCARLLASTLLGTPLGGEQFAAAMVIGIALSLYSIEPAPARPTRDDGSRWVGTGLDGGEGEAVAMVRAGGGARSAVEEQEGSDGGLRSDKLGELEEGRKPKD